MDSSMSSSLLGKNEVKKAFRKPSADAANRKYRRHSPISSSEGSPKRGLRSSPKFSTEDLGRRHEHRTRRKDNEKELERNSDRCRSTNADSYKHSDGHSSRTLHGHSKHHDDYIRHEMYDEEEERSYHKSSHSGRESRGCIYSEHGKTRDHLQDVEKSSQDKYDGSRHRSKEKDHDSSFDKSGSGRRRTHYEEMEKERRAVDRDDHDKNRENRRGSGNYRIHGTLSHEESRSHRSISSSRRDGGNDLREFYYTDVKGLGGQDLSKQEKEKYDDQEACRSKGWYIKEPVEKSGDKEREDNESFTKRQKSFQLEKDIDYVNSVTNFSTVADRKESFSFKQSNDSEGTAGHIQANDTHETHDISTAKVAAMKAAELVNKNLSAVGSMTTDEKKRLLWGKKKKTTPEESVHCWDTPLFTDRDRQEKFNKLMSLRLPWCLWPIVGRERQSETRAQSRKQRWQRPTPSREAERTAAGFGEAIHCWTSTERWSYCWFRSLGILVQLLRILSPSFERPIVWDVMLPL